MKVLFIGGTGNISTAVSRLAAAKGIELYLLNRGRRKVDIPGVNEIRADIADVAAVREAIAGHRWDCVADFIAYTPDQIERDYDLFADCTKQYIFISSASAYQKPPTSHIITESTPLINPYWQYSRDKIACEDLLNRYYRESGFPITIVRPSHTYDRVIPTAVGGGDGYFLIDRMLRGAKVIVHGDGTSLWTLTHSEDFAKGFVGLIGNPLTIGHAFHITSDEVYTWNKIYQIIGSCVGVRPDIVHIPSDYLASFDEHLTGGLIGDKANCAVFDNAKIKSFVPEYRSSISFQEGVGRAIRHLQEAPGDMALTQEKNAFMDRVIRCYQRACDPE
jgi:nucleoside-diphosphate-sugar epimerase